MSYSYEEKRSLLEKEKEADRKHIGFLQLENSELRSRLNAPKDCDIEIGLHELYMEKLKTANRLLDELNISLAAVGDMAESIRGEGDKLDVRLDETYRSHTGKLLGILDDFSREFPTRLSGVNREQFKDVDSRIGRVEDELAGILNKILFILSQRGVNDVLEREVLEKLKVKLQ